METEDTKKDLQPTKAMQDSSTTPNQSGCHSHYTSSSKKEGIN